MASNQSESSGGGSNQEPKKKPAGINDMILSSMKSRSGRETTRWINNLTQEGLKEIEEASTGAAAPNALPAQFAHPSIAQMQVKWVDRLFDIIQQYEVEFNRATQIPDLRVVTERALITPDLISRLQSNDQYHYTGRVHTRFWTLAIIGNLSHIEGYIIPSDHFIGFENNTSSYLRLFEFIPMWDGELKWSFERGSIALGQLPSMVKLIFGHLIRVAKGDIDSEEPFNYGLSAPVRPTAGPPPWKSPLSTVNDDGSAPEYLLRHTGVFEDDNLIQSEEIERSSPVSRAKPAEKARDGGPGPGNGFPSETEGKSGAGRISESLAPDSKPLEKRAVNELQNAGRPGEGREVRTPETSSGVGGKDVPGLAAACDILGRSIGRELELLSKAGARAFEEHDFAEVEKLMKRTAKLKAMQDKMLATISEWKKLLQEE